MAVDESNLCFIDCETTGLDPERHVPWEIALIIDGAAHSYTLDLSIDEGAQADPMALKVGDFYGRGISRSSDDAWCKGRQWGWVSQASRAIFAKRMAHDIGTRHLVGNVVSFDARFVGDFLRRNGSPPIWHYHLIDVESLAAGYLRADPPWNSEDLSLQLDISPGSFERHTALGDAQWARAMYQVVMSSG